MNKGRLFGNLVHYAWKVICQQFLLLAVLSMLFLLLPLCAGPVAQGLLSRGVEFSGIKLAVTTQGVEEADSQVEDWLGKMQDIQSFCRVESMEREAALTALEAGEVSAVLVLPEGFLEGVLNGTNPDVLLITSTERPLEALLTRWVGQSAADQLSAAQRGIYAVLEAYPGEEQCNVSYGRVLEEINFEFIRRTLNRQSMFRLRTLQAVEGMDTGRHYSLGLLVFLLMGLAPVFVPLYGEDSVAFRRRLRSAGCGSAIQYAAIFTVHAGICFGLLLLPGLAVLKCSVGGILLAALFAAAYAAVCCLLTRSASGCSALTFFTAAGGLLLSGGILPSPLLPGWLRTLGGISPVGMLRTLLHLPAGEWGSVRGALVGALLWTSALAAAGIGLYSRRLLREVEDR